MDYPKPSTIPSVTVNQLKPRDGQRVIFQTRNAVYIGVYRNGWVVNENDSFEDADILSWAPSPFLKIEP